MPAVKLDAHLFKRPYRNGYYYRSTWDRYRWLMLLLLLIPLGFLLCFFMGCRFLGRSNRRRINNGTAPIQQWYPEQQGQYYKEGPNQYPPTYANMQGPDQNLQYPNLTYQRPQGPPPPPNSYWYIMIRWKIHITSFIDLYILCSVEI